MEVDTRESDAEDSDYYYGRLKDGKYKVKTANGMFTCPFCETGGARDNWREELIRHASEHVKSSCKNKHLALLRFAEKHLAEKDGEAHAKEKFVWPWMGIVATVPAVKDGKPVGHSGSRLRDDFTKQGFFPRKVVPLWTRHGFSGIYVVYFRSDWNGFSNAMMFEKKFEVERRGKREWYCGRPRSDSVYGWVARSDEYNSTGLIGEHVRRNGDLKSISEIEKDEERKDTKLVSGLHDVIQQKNLQFKEVKSKLDVTESSMRNVVKEKDEMHRVFNEEMSKLEACTRQQLQNIISTQDNAKSQLEAQRKKLVQREKELDKREALKEDELKKLTLEKQMIEIAVIEQKRASEKLAMLAEEHQSGKEELHKRIIDLEKQLDAKQALELKIERLKGARKVMKHMSDEGDLDFKKKMGEIGEELKDTEEDLDNLEATYHSLVVKQRRTNDELQDARKELIANSDDFCSSNAPILRAKRMGDLEIQPFMTASKRKYSAAEVNMKAVESCSEWEKHIMDPNWHPFKILHENGNVKEVINEADEKLKELKDEYGEEVYEAVVTAVREMNEYNPSGRYPVMEFWNFKEGRKAALTEVIQTLVDKWRLLRGKKKK